MTDQWNPQSTYTSYKTLLIKYINPPDKISIFQHVVMKQWIHCRLFTFPDASKDATSAQESAKKQETEFSQVSQDMSELVYHLNTIQNDISELAGRPISLTRIED